MKNRSSGIDEIRKLQGHSVGYLLIRTGQLYNERGIARVNQAAGMPLLREAHTRLLPHLLEPGGIRITELARRLDVTKQAIQQLIADMVEANVVRYEPDPEDARARRIVLTAPGLAAMKQGTQVLLDIETELRPEFDERKLKQLRTLLARLLDVLERLPDV